MITRLIGSTLVWSLALTWGCRSTGRMGAPDPSAVPLLKGLGSHGRPVTTASPLAQKYVNQGLVLAFAFNHDEAIRAFTEAARLDTNCGMAWWGIALCHGPHINNPVMPETRSQAAWDALQKALARKKTGTLTEQALIEALAHRYASPPPADRKPLDEAYAAAMRAVWHAHALDSDVGTLYAEAMMDLRPWNLWTNEGQPNPGTEEIIATLDTVLRVNSSHPGANHLYIHALEASPHPERALAAADRIRRSVPASGHLVHMPSHIDVLTGQWSKAVQQNEWAVEADRKYRAIVPRQDFYRMYMGHNQHMLAFAAMMAGRESTAQRAARELVAAIPPDYLEKNPAIVDPFFGATTDVLMRFGRWDEILTAPAPPAILPYSTAKWHFARGVSYAALGQVTEAEKEQAAFRTASSAISPDLKLAINHAKDVLAIADHMLDGEIAFRRGDMDRAVSALRQAIQVEDHLGYMEPPEWIQPVRHTLGAFLVNAGRYDQAEKVYREDLAEWPENGWSLFGLSECLRARGGEELRDVEKRFRNTWSRADIRLASSCLCVAKR